MSMVLIYCVAAVCEIAGCFSFWAWVRLGRSPLWLAPGGLLLVAFASLLTLVQVDAAGRAFAAYGGIYVAASCLWMWLVEGVWPDRWDMAGAMLCIAGAAVIVLAPHRA
ncbi:MAG: YnfA family protein [Acetobacter sp.]|uniref:UPF0060 membrane protein n=1 Tax=Acetobacter peroxydans TaxID=104098 RepID=A0A4Y3TYP9_9PROT|nr:YnfA family protein [Acetobacter peroxydans]NHO17235.1 YnfA family protein [Acetobacter peroxydans]GBR38290.1 hypothetical protein AA13755_2154 [Acetobacter peroxydans NBRC 13755]GBR40213.1 hypothetical protein AA0475_0531 [Acetobacter peroxydans]GEB86327.1 UPF0060 membrane protein [Acetobacter peroxydans]